MVILPLKKTLICFLLISATCVWPALGIADEWEKMRVQKFETRVDPPQMSLKGLDGKKVDLADFKGKVVFLNFWTTWCGYCKREMPAMDKLYKELKDKGFVILAVDVGESADKVKSYLDRNPLAFPVALDQSGAGAQAFRVRGYPATFLIDRNGKLAGGASGAREWYNEDSKALMGKLLAEKVQKVQGDNDGERQASIEEESADEEIREPESGFDLNSIVGPPVYSQGQATVQNGQMFDLDKGVVGNEQAADFSWSESGMATRYLIPQNGAEFSPKGMVDQVSFDDILLASYSSSPVNGTEGEKNRIASGTIVYARTNERRFACLRIDQNGGGLGLGWITYDHGQPNQ
jgi:thiol-disulfide isomerase/thioredoxin